MLKIRRCKVDGSVVFALSGRIQEEDLPELEALIGHEAGGSSIALDLEEVRLVHREAVRFLAACEAQGIRLEKCPAYVREWIGRGSDSHVS
jgi:hypothetical protein